MIDAIEVRRLLNYDCETGNLFWKTSHNRCAMAGWIAGTVRPSGYVEIGIKGRYYKAHRIAWLYVHGHWPTGDIDHKNGVKHDNRLSNLREATDSQNQANAKLSKRNSIGLKGVSLFRGRWRARIKFNGKTINIGCFADRHEAHSAYTKKARELFGEFARPL